MLLECCDHEKEGKERTEVRCLHKYGYFCNIRVGRQTRPNSLKENFLTKSGGESVTTVTLVTISHTSALGMSPQGDPHVRAYGHLYCRK